jgi:predicted transposase/invertase (TIGR01784 family)
LQKYSDKTIRAIESIFLQKSLLAFKHFWDTVYLKLNFVEFLVFGEDEKKDDETRSFFKKLLVYLLEISKMTRAEIIEQVNKSDHNLKHQAMSVIEEFIEQGEKQGIEKGIEKANRETIIRSWKNGIEIPMIANITGLDIAKIKAVIADFESKS